MPLLLASTLIDYLAAIRMDKAKSLSSRRRWFFLSVLSNLSLLGFFKYWGFVGESLDGMFHWVGFSFNFPHFDLLLPVGISFYTLQSLAYSIDVYREKKKPERNFVSFALYVSFFPQLVAGPVERAGHLLPQLKKAQTPYQ